MFATLHRNLKIRYAQTVLGSLWIILQPIITLALFVVIFDQLLGIYSGKAPYALFAFCGIITWNLFANIATQGGMAVVQQQDLVKRIYFPRILLVFAQVLTALTDFGISLCLLLLAGLFMGMQWSALLLLLPFFLLVVILLGTGFALLLNVLGVKRRDYYQILPYLLNFGMWVTPVFYAESIIPQSYRFLLYFNPMAGVIQGFRWILLQTTPPDMGYLPVFALSALIFCLGFYAFKQYEPHFTDAL